MSKTVQDEALQLSGYDEVTAQSTTSAVLEDIPGLTFDIEMTKGGQICARMTVECSSTGAANNTGAWAISINGVDGTEIQRFLSGTSDTGAMAVQAAADLPAGTYTIKGRHRRAGGAGTINTDVAQLSAIMIG